MKAITIETVEREIMAEALEKYSESAPSGILAKLASQIRERILSGEGEKSAVVVSLPVRESGTTSPVVSMGTKRGRPKRDPNEPKPIPAAFARLKALWDLPRYMSKGDFITALGVKNEHTMGVMVSKAKQLTGGFDIEIPPWYRTSEYACAFAVLGDGGTMDEALSASGVEVGAVKMMQCAWSKRLAAFCNMSPDERKAYLAKHFLTKWVDGKPLSVTMGELAVGSRG